MIRAVTKICTSRIVYVAVSHSSSTKLVKCSFTNSLLPRRCKSANFVFRMAFSESLPADCMISRSIPTSRSWNPPLLLTGKIPGHFRAVANTASATSLTLARLISDTRLQTFRTYHFQMTGRRTGQSNTSLVFDLSSTSCLFAASALCASSGSA